MSEMVLKKEEKAYYLIILVLNVFAIEFYATVGVVILSLLSTFKTLYSYWLKLTRLSKIAVILCGIALMIFNVRALNLRDICSKRIDNRMMQGKIKRDRRANQNPAKCYHKETEKSATKPQEIRKKGGCTYAEGTGSDASNTIVISDPDKALTNSNEVLINKDTSKSRDEMFIHVNAAIKYHAEGNYESCANEFHKAKDVESCTNIFQYCEAMSYYKSKIVDTLAKALDLLTELKFNPKVPNCISAKLMLFVNYGLARIFCAFKAYEEALNETKAGMDIVKQALQEPEEIRCGSIWKEVNKAFPELVVGNMEDLLKELAYEAGYFRRPLAYCCGEECFDVIQRPYINTERAIYINDIDFKGFYSMICNNHFKIDYHVLCFKMLKEQAHTTNNQYFIGNDCLTPDCGGKITEVIVFKENGEQKILASDKIKNKWKTNVHLN